MHENPKVSVTQKRPGTAKSRGLKRPNSAYKSTYNKYGQFKPMKIKKSDPVSRYQSMQNSWKSSKFLRTHKGTKQGRKLDLAGFN